MSKIQNGNVKVVVPANWYPKWSELVTDDDGGAWMRRFGSQITTD